jgi:hypothetical protein
VLGSGQTSWIGRVTGLDRGAVKGDVLGLGKARLDAGHGTNLEATLVDKFPRSVGPWSCQGGVLGFAKSWTET